MKKNFIILWILCMMSFAMGSLKIHGWKWVNLEGKEISLSTGTSKLFFFFSGNIKQAEANFQELQKLVYAYERHGLEVFAIYSDLEPLDIKIQEIWKKQFPLIAFGQDLDRKMMRNLQEILQENVLFPPVLVALDLANIIQYHKAKRNFSYYELREYAKVALKYQQKPNPQIPYPIQENKNWIAETQQMPKIAFRIILPEGDSLAKAPKENDLVQEEKIIEETPLVQIPEKVDTLVVQIPEKKDTSLPLEKKSPIISSGEIPLPTYSVEEKENKITKTVATQATMPRKSVEENQFPSVVSREEENLSHTFLTSVLYVSFPLFSMVICFWGMLYTLSKVKTYYGMLSGFLACFLYFSWSGIQFFSILPHEILVLSSTLWDLHTQIHSYQSIITSSSFQQGSLIFLQFALLAGLAGKCKKEKEI